MQLEWTCGQRLALRWFVLIWALHSKSVDGDGNAIAKGDSGENGIGLPNHDCDCLVRYDFV